jgi:hypothetical protein
MAEDEELSSGQQNDMEREIELRVFMKETIIYRKSLCGKVDDLKNNQSLFIARVEAALKAIDERHEKMVLVVTSLPCRERKSWYNSMSKQMGFMWTVLLAFIGLAIWGLISNAIVQKEVSLIQKYSYGWQDKQAGVNPLAK